MKISITDERWATDELREFTFSSDKFDFQILEGMFLNDPIDRTVHRFCDDQHQYALTLHHISIINRASRPLGEGWERCEGMLSEFVSEHYALWRRPIDQQRDEREKLAALQISGGAL